MRVLARVLVGAVVAVGALAGLGACATSEPGGLATDAVVVDVRTPDEFAAGHLQGAVNVDVEAPDFAARVAQLDTDVPYVLYCRSGNRARVAAEYMEANGFTDVTNAGGIDDAAASTGLPVVTS